jgi:hypothetical protein
MIVDNHGDVVGGAHPTSSSTSYIGVDAYIRIHWRVRAQWRFQGHRLVRFRSLVRFRFGPTSRWAAAGPV